MVYIPHTEAERKAMLRTVGVGQIGELFEDIPEHVRYPDLELPRPCTEMEAIAELSEISSFNVNHQDTPVFLGAGAYRHYIPAVVDTILQRGEFLTAYTPYQPEVSQGTLQAIYEYQSMICALTGMDVANASHYDGATALAEAAIMALQIYRGKRTNILVLDTVHPHYLQTMKTYLQDAAEIQNASSIEELRLKIDDNTALVVVQSPDYLGRLRHIESFGDVARGAGALLAAVVNPISLGMIKAPGDSGADIVVGEGQPLGIPLSYGGPYLGFFATRNKHVRRMSGRIVGEAKDIDGNPGYVLTLSTREQHIRRERATSNICTNQGLMALAATVYLAALGKNGFEQVSKLCYHRAHYAAREIGDLDSFSIAYDEPFFNEFVVECPIAARDVNEQLLDNWGIIGGRDLGEDLSGMENHMLVAVTEMNSRDQIDQLVSALEEISNA
ncbi:MAG: aminomethyl-transferring glycine dehydrogenase subunit GcvPA [Chloroflexota bacterium]